MKKHFNIKLLCLLLAACFLLSACSEVPVPEEEKTPVVSIWYVQDALLSAELVSLSEQFNRESDSVKAELKAYPDEASLGSALDSARPDLILCGYERAASLYEQGRLRDVSSALPDPPAYRESFLSDSGCVGRSFFPIGAETQLLVLNGAAFDASPASALGREALSSLESLCAAASDFGREDAGVFFTADSFTALFTAALGSSGNDFSGVRQVDIQSESYKNIYNLLANAAYEGGLAAWDVPALPLVESGEVICAFISSTGLTEGLAEGLELYPMPTVGEAHFARAVGLAVTSPFSGGGEAAAQFLSWLCRPQRAVSLALSAGLTPASEGWEPKEPGKLDAVLLSLASSRLYFPSLDSGYFKSGGEFERSFRAALEMLK